MIRISRNTDLITRSIRDFMFNVNKVIDIAVIVQNLYKILK
jgi:hypothetical protein